MLAAVSAQHECPSCVEKHNERVHMTGVEAARTTISSRSAEALAAFFGAKSLEEAHRKGRAELEEKSERLRLVILGVEPMHLLGALWGQLLMGANAKNSAPAQPPRHKPAAFQTVVLALEYVHAVLSGYEETGARADDEGSWAVITAAEELHEVTLRYCMVAAALVPEAKDFETQSLALHAMTSWAILRGHRHQVLEEEFFNFVLGPHDEALRRVYGVGAGEIAKGIQQAVDATRFGHERAREVLAAEHKKTVAYAKQERISVREAINKVYASDEAKVAMKAALDDIFMGGICDAGKSSGLPAALLDDLSFGRGEDKQFFAEGALRGTPMRRLPARERPLVRMNGKYLATDPSFLRDTAYRGIQWGLCGREAGYEKIWGERQAEVTELAFPHLMAAQLAGATVLQSIFYPDPETQKWVENDLVVMLDDTLLQIEVKAGVMPMHSPELQFDTHLRTVRSLVIKAKQQCERFFRYAASAPEVPLYALQDGKHIEVHRLSLAKFRVAIPIGLTVEAFTPFSSMSKRLPEMAPILGKHPFVSMSVDDLFVLARFLPSTGELFHYLSVRQQVAGQPNAMLMDEQDHLGRYVTENRLDMAHEDHFSEGVTMLMHDGASDVVDNYFDAPDWEKVRPPRQKYPARLATFLSSLDADRGRRFLSTDAAVRDLSGSAREHLNHVIGTFLPSLKERPYRWTLIDGDGCFLVWLQRSNYADIQGMMTVRAQELAVALERKSCQVLVMYVGPTGEFEGGWSTTIDAPEKSTLQYAQRMMDGQKHVARGVSFGDRREAWKKTAE